MFVLKYIASNFVMLAELVGLWVLSGISVHVTKRTLVYTRASVLLLLLDSVLFNVEVWTQSFETLSIWRPILSYTIYALQPIILIMMMQITAAIRRGHFWLLLPEILGALLYFTSPWTHYVCWFTEDNRYQGGALAILPYAVFGFYVVIFVIRCALHKGQNHLRDRIVAIYLVVGAVIGVVLYEAFDLSDDYSAIFTSAILLYYLYLYIHMANLDPLTGLLNRKCYYKDIHSFTGRISAVASVDMNELKWVNDTQGHAEGDLAIKTIAACLSVNSGKSKMVYRVGGDEFMVLYCGKTEEQVVDDVKAMRSALAETPYVCAFGYAMTKGSNDIEAVIRDSDGRMYEDKAKLKQDVLDHGGEIHDRED